MSKAERICDTPRIYQWKTDGTPCDGIDLASYSSILVEVRGDLSGGSVKFLGGLTKATADDLSFLDEVNVRGIVTLPPVLHLLPVTDVAGLTITLKGIA